MQLDSLIRSAQENDLHILHVVVRQHREVIAEHHFVADKPVLLWSVSKTFTSMAVGIAAHEGFFELHDRLAVYFPAAAQAGFDRLTIRDLLCMGTGQQRCPMNTALSTGANLDDIEALFFAEPVVYQPGQHFVYNNAATYMLSKLISKTTGCCLVDYLGPRIFAPLEIHSVEWEKDVNGINYGCSGLHLNAHDLAKFGQLLLDQGVWAGRQLIPAEYIAAATRKQIDTADFNEPFATADHRSGYGYQLWLNSYPNSYRMDGLYGQYGVVLPEKDAVVTFVSNEPSRMTAILELTWQFIVDQL